MERWQRFGSFVFSLLAGTAMSHSAGAQQPSGATVRVSPAANATGVTGARVLDVPGDIYSGDEITTTRGGEAQIRFVDDTRFIVGPNSRAVIDEFVFNPNRTAADVGLSAVKGSFRFISGRSPSEAYTIRTPTVTIGVRGSAGDIAVRPGGETIIVWLDGRATICDDSIPRQCVEAPPGSVTVAPPGGGFRDPNPGETGQLIRTYFPYLGTPSGLDPAFVVGTPGGIPGPGPSGDERNTGGDDSDRNDRPDTGDDDEEEPPSES